MRNLKKRGGSNSSEAFQREDFTEMVRAESDDKGTTEIWVPLEREEWFEFEKAAYALEAGEGEPVRAVWVLLIRMHEKIPLQGYRIRRDQGKVIEYPNRAEKIKYLRSSTV